jgi:hypothetical protein
MRTPPGWYADPGYTGIGPAQERWWDGEQWTDHTRAAAGPPVAPPGYPAPGAPSGGRSQGTVVAAVVAGAVVLAALVVGGVVLVNSGDGGRPGAAPTAAGPSVSPDDTPRGGPETGAPSPDAGEMALATGVSLPLPGGWVRADGARGAAVTHGEYRCAPDKPERCVRGGATLWQLPASGTARSLAEADIAANAEQAYSEEFYGGITSHEEVRSEAVDVAGEDGYRVRWKIDNEKDPDAYVESVVFAHPDGSGRMVVLRTGLDIHGESPPVSDMDKLVDGITEGSVSDDGSSEQV